MNDPGSPARRSTWERWAPVSGLAFVALSLSAWLLFIGAPGVDGSAADAADFVRGERSRLLAAAFLSALALVPYLSFLGLIVSTVHRAGQAALAIVALCGGLLAATLFALIVAIPAALAFNIAGTVDPQITKAIYDLVWPLQVLIAFPTAVLVGAISLASLRCRLFPSGVCWAGLGAATVVLVGGTTWSRTGYWSPSHGYGYAALFVFLSWIVVTSVLLLWYSRDTRALNVSDLSAAASQ
jgi:hypothetical protein